MRNLKLLSVLYAFLVVSCAALPANVKAPMYTADESARLGLCSALADHIFSIAKDKKDGMTIFAVKARYVGNKFQKELEPIINGIYSNDFSSPWDYTAFLYKDCAVNLANVSLDRSDQAKTCMQLELVSRVARDNREAGTNRSIVENYFRPVSGSKEIVEKVFSEKVGSPPHPMSEWNKCISPFVRK